MSRGLAVLLLVVSLCGIGSFADPSAEKLKGGKNKPPSKTSGPPSCKKTILFGPGLNPRIATPARYLFIQAVDNAGTNFTSSPGGDAFQASVVMSILGDTRRKNVKHELFDQGDGTFQLFFVFNDQPERMTIEVVCKSDGQLVGGKPIEFEWPEIEQCKCPAGDGDDFASHFGCRDTEVQLERDMEKFPVITSDMVKQSFDALIGKESCFVHYVIRKGKIFAKSYGKFQAFKQYIDEVLVSLARRVRLPDAEFVFNLGDWPQANTTASGLPVLSWCGSNDTDDVVLPTYKSTLSTLYGKDMENIRDVDARCYRQGGWGKKIKKVFWRGRDSNPIRTKFVDEIGAYNLQYVDANISKNHFNYYPSEEDRRNDKRLQAGKKVERVNFHEYWRFRYLLNLDGTVAAYRLPALLAGDSVVLKQDSKWYEHFYAELEPFVHFIPVKEDVSDVLEQVQWARTYDQRAMRIARQGREYARSRLGAEQILCYYYRTLERYGAVMDYKPTIPAGYDEVAQPSPDCLCSQKPKRRKKGRKGEIGGKHGADGQTQQGTAGGASEGRIGARMLTGWGRKGESAEL